MTHQNNQGGYQPGDWFGSWYGPGGTPAYQGSQPFHKEGYPDTSKTNFQENPWDPGFDWFKYSASPRKDVFGRGNYSLLGSVPQAALYDFTRLQQAGKRQVDEADHAIQQMEEGKEGTVQRGKERLDMLGGREDEMDALFSDYGDKRSEEEESFFAQLFGDANDEGMRSGGLMGDMRNTMEGYMGEATSASDEAVAMGKQSLEDIKSYGVEVGAGAMQGASARAEARIGELASDPNIPDGIKGRMIQDIRRQEMGQGRQQAVMSASSAQDANIAQSNIVSGLLNQKSALHERQAGTEMQMTQFDVGTRIGTAQWKASRDDAQLAAKVGMKQMFTSLDQQVVAQTDASLKDWDSQIAGGHIKKSEIIGTSIASLMDAVTAQFAIVSSMGPRAVAAAKTAGYNEEIMDKLSAVYGIDFSRTSLKDAMSYVRNRERGSLGMKTPGYTPSWKGKIHFQGHNT